MYNDSFIFTDLFVQLLATTYMHVIATYMCYYTATLLANSIVLHCCDFSIREI